MADLGLHMVSGLLLIHMVSGLLLIHTVSGLFLIRTVSGLVLIHKVSGLFLIHKVSGLRPSHTVSDLGPFRMVMSLQTAVVPADQVHIQLCDRQDNPLQEVEPGNHLSRVQVLRLRTHPVQLKFHLGFCFQQGLQPAQAPVFPLF